MAKFIRNMNWELLRKQKEILVNLASEKSENTCLSKAEQDDLDGIVHLIDAIQDWAVEELKVDENYVFPGLGEEDKKQVIIDEINAIIEKHGDFSITDVDADHSPYVEGKSNLSHLMEDFTTDGGRVFVYDPTARGNAEEIDRYDADFEDLSLSQLEYVLELAKKWVDYNE